VTTSRTDLEAPSFKLPTVNIGTCQDRRVEARNAIDLGYERTHIVAGIKTRSARTSVRLLLPGQSNCQQYKICAFNDSVCFEADIDLGD
jgi:hypothetical protein